MKYSRSRADCDLWVLVAQKQEKAQVIEEGEKSDSKGEMQEQALRMVFGEPALSICDCVECKPPAVGWGLGCYNGHWTTSLTVLRIGHRVAGEPRSVSPW